MSRLLRLVRALLVVSVALAPAIVQAEVTRLEILRREVVLNGQAFGAAGAYEKLVGRVHFALDPRTPQNHGIVDLALAPRNAQGLVEFSADFYLLKPVDPAAATGGCSTKPATAAASGSCRCSRTPPTPPTRRPPRSSATAR